MSEQNTEFDINQPFVTQEQKFKYWEESKAHIKEANKRIDALKNDNKIYAECNTTLKTENECLSSSCKSITEKYLELKASNKHLREAGQALIDRWDSPKWVDNEHTGVFIDALRKALSTTPAESLVKRDDEVIEKCAKVCDEDAIKSREFAEPFAARCAELLAEAIRALKGK